MKKVLVFVLSMFIFIISLFSHSIDAKGVNESRDRSLKLNGMTKDYNQEDYKMSTYSTTKLSRDNNKLVLLEESMDIDFIEKKFDFEYFEFIGNEHLNLIEVSNKDYKKLQNDKQIIIESVEDVIVRKSESMPNDVYRNEQWGLYETNYFTVWDRVESTSEIMTCVINSGISRNHPDFAGTDIRAGYNYITTGDVTYDQLGHGTSVTGIISATTNNNIGISRISNSVIIPLNVSDRYGDIYTSNTIQAIYDSADLGCDVINLSLGSERYSSLEAKAVDYAISKGVLVIAAAGNEGNHLHYYPASYDNVVSVGSINSNLKWSDFSNYNNQVTVVAPGEDIITTNNNHSYSNASGTSFSAPFVSAIAAILKDQDQSINQFDFIDILASTSIDLGQIGFDNYYGHGLLNIEEIIDMKIKQPPIFGDDIEAGWAFDDNEKNWHYIDQDGQLKTGWLKFENSWYFLNEKTTAREEGWLKVNNVWYYFNNSGIMQTGWQTINNNKYYLSDSGAMRTGWLLYEGREYYLNSSGAMTTDWSKIDDLWHYFKKDGILQTGWMKINNTWYYSDNTGAMQTGWKKINNTWYYLDNSGAMQKDWIKINNTWYYMNNGGAMQTGWLKIKDNWYYLNSNGAMQTGKKSINNKTYYFTSSGRMK